MSREMIKDHNGKTLGYMEIYSDGKAELRDSNSVILGKYTNIDNLTRDTSGKVIGKGNMLMSLIKLK
jgi:hypothetical protein